MNFSQTVSQQVRLVSNIRSASQSLFQINLIASQISQQDQVTSRKILPWHFQIPPFLLLSSCHPDSCPFLFTTVTSLTLINQLFQLSKNLFSVKMKKLFELTPKIIGKAQEQRLGPPSRFFHGHEKQKPKQFAANLHKGGKTHIFGELTIWPLSGSSLSTQSNGNVWNVYLF